MKQRAALSYRSAGVDIDAMQQALARVRRLARSASRPEVLGDAGGFGGLFRLSRGRLRDPVLVASVDGVGTKLRVALEAGIHDTVGEDLVAHCVNDILVQGAEPLFFMDYLATGSIKPRVVVEVVSGIARACRKFGLALLGGETAEMPGFYTGGDYDLAGFIVGVVERRRLLERSKVRPGDRLVGLASNGLHTNGYSLARKILFERLGLGLRSRVGGMRRTVAQVLLRPHRCYLRAVRPLLRAGSIHSMAHITGGGLTDNLPRALPRGCAARVRTGAWRMPPIFRVLQQGGSVGDAEMRRTFNLGVGMVLVVPAGRLKAVLRALGRGGERAFDIGEIVRGRTKVIYE
ncbi:MAG: phosphoribosylformylglycinamidine cyclo-ligase [Acidobacteriota bacterium]